ncbi:MAG: hypothetical protein GY866_24900 [Proteobacteria bacterium]|nr:hypothetical protein [Pseudomonadota bacterium]
MNKNIIALAVFVISLMVASSAYSVDFIYRNEKGVFHFDCVNACGPVKVRKSDKCEFFVQSIYYSGKVQACSAEIAARKSCGELKFDRPVRKELLNPACL